MIAYILQNGKLKSEICSLRLEQWNGGTMEYWESRADDGLIL